MMTDILVGLLVGMLFSNNILFYGVGVSIASDSTNSFKKTLFYGLSMLITCMLSATFFAVISKYLMVGADIEYRAILLLISIVGFAIVIEFVTRRVFPYLSVMFDKIPFVAMTTTTMLVLFAISFYNMVNILEIVLATLFACVGFLISSILVLHVQGAKKSQQFLAVDLIAIAILSMIFLNI